MRHLEGFILANSGEAKDTTGVLGEIKRTTLAGVEQLKTVLPAFDLYTTPYAETEELLDTLTIDRKTRNYTLACLATRDHTERARQLLSSDSQVFDPEQLGEIIDAHHTTLRDLLGTSTPKIEQMIAEAKAAGALGAKIVGSGRGGCMLAYAPGT